MLNRRYSREVKVGSLTIGGRSKISIQSMTNTDTCDVEATYRQVKELSDAGCDIIRITAPTVDSVKTFSILKERGITTPLVADIHFNYKIAVAAAECGVDKIRINPGNIGGEENVKAVVDACRLHGVPIRIGVNSGSVEADLLQKYGSPTAEALAESALRHVALLEKHDFYDTVISVKASNVPTMLEANRIIADRTSYPIHLGVTEAGGGTSAVVKSSIGIGALLAEGIGDTVRVSLTDKPINEVYAAREILGALHLCSNGMDVVSCPTCGRTRIDLITLLDTFKERVRAEGLDETNIKVALMGCVVNGPGEAREADIGIAGGNGEGLIFKKGEILRKVPENMLIDELIKEIKIIKEDI